MDRNRVLELAIAELERQRAGIEEDIAAVRAQMGGREAAVLARSASAGIRRRRARTLAQRRKHSEKMKLYWMRKRARTAKASSAKPKAFVITGAKIRKWTAAEKKALSLKLKAAWKKRRTAAAKRAKAKS